MELFSVTVKKPAWSPISSSETLGDIPTSDHDNSPENNWLTPGGDLDLLSDYGYGANGLIKRAPVVEGEWLSLDITAAVQSWLTSPDTNHGLLLRGILRPGNVIHLASRNNGDYSLAPKVEYHYFGEPIDTHVDGNLDRNSGDNSAEHAGN